ncbi:MAG: hypothetical protein R2873_11045 [Caldilineaceae bacterium]
MGSYRHTWADHHPQRCAVGEMSIAAADSETFDGVWMNMGGSLHMTPQRYHPGIGLRPGGESPELEPLIAELYAAMYESIAAHSRMGVKCGGGRRPSRSLQPPVGDSAVLCAATDGCCRSCLWCAAGSMITERRRATGWPTLSVDEPVGHRR